MSKREKGRMPYVEGKRRPDLERHLSEVIKSCRGDITKLSMACASIATASSSTLKVSGLAFLMEELRKRMKEGEGIEGDINYCISRLIYESLGLGKPGYRSTILKTECVLVGAEEAIRAGRAPNMVLALATLRLVAREMYRRFAIGYEEEKLKANGDIVGEVGA